MTDTPWMTPHEAATYSRRHVKTIYAALREYRRTKKTGLRGVQPDVRCSWCIHRDDLEAWMAAEKPKRLRRVA